MLGIVYIILFLYYLFVFGYSMMHLNLMLLGYNNFCMIKNPNMLLSTYILSKCKNARNLGKIVLFLIFLITFPIDILGFVFGYIMGISLRFFIYLLDKNIPISIITDFMKLKSLKDIC